VRLSELIWVREKQKYFCKGGWTGNSLICSSGNLAAAFARTGEIKIGPDQRRAAQRGEDAARPWRFAGDGPADSRSNPRSLRVVLGKPLCQGPYEVAVGIETENLKSRHAALDQPGPIIPQRSLLCGVARDRLPGFRVNVRNSIRLDH
jgi:hypothetical protein